MLTPNIQKEVAIAAVNDMMRKSYFSICAIDRVAQVLEINVEHSPSYKALRALHCIDFGNMSPELRKSIPGMIKEVFDDATDVFQFPTPNTKPASVLGTDVIDVEVVKPGFWKRLLGN